MLAALILVFREILEAALIVSIMAVATAGVVGRDKWIWGGIALGVVGAVLLALGANALGESMDGVGQEVFGACVLLTGVAMIGWHVVWMSRSNGLVGHLRDTGRAIALGNKGLIALLIVVGIAVLREGSEIVLFGYGVMMSGVAVNTMIIGGLIGLLCGVGVGAGLYFGLMRMPVKNMFSLTNLLLVFIAGGMSSMAAGKLIQADMLSLWTTPLWDSEWLVSENSVFGQTLHILIGYTAQPSGMQLVFYVVTVSALLIGMRVKPKTPKMSKPNTPILLAT